MRDTSASLSESGLVNLDEQRIDIYPGNPRYWSYKGSPVLLLGGSDEDNLFNHPDLLRANMKTLPACGGNYIRSTLSSRDPGNVWAYAKTGVSYDLERFNPEYWDRLRVCLEECYRLDIIVQIEVWATFDFYRENWPLNPFNPAINVNYTTENTHLVEEWDHHPARKRQPFFFSPEALNNDTVLLPYQEAFVIQVLDVSLEFPNVLYCIDNETLAPPEWPLRWGRFIRDEAAKRGKNVHITEIGNPWDLREPDHAVTYSNPDVFSFTEVAQNNWQQGETHYERLIWYRENLLANGGPRPMNNVKVYGRERPREPRIASLNVDRFWKNVFAGCASSRFHRPDSGLGLNETAQKMVRAARNFTSAFDIFSAEPRNDLLTDREEDEAYCLANPGDFHAVYFPDGGDITVDVGAGKGGHEVRWMDVDNATFHPSERVAGPAVRLKTPAPGGVQLALVKPS